MILNMLITHTHSSTATASRRSRRIARRTTLTACTITALAVPAVASGADTLVVADRFANEVTALDGTIVWLSGFDGDEERNTDQVLMQRTGGVSKRVDGAPRASYDSIDLGRDSSGKLVLTYTRCSQTRCTSLRDDLRGKRTSFKHLTRKRCELERAPVVWGTRLAYSQYCRKPDKAGDNKRSGLYVKAGASSPRRLRSPSKASWPTIPARDLRGSRVAGVAGFREAYAFTETVGGNDLQSLRIGLREGTSNSRVMDVSLQSTSVMWTLVGSETATEPKRVKIIKMLSDCYERETIAGSPAAPYVFPATDLAADGTTLYLVVPYAGIVTHEFASQEGCREL